MKEIKKQSLSHRVALGKILGLFFGGIYVLSFALIDHLLLTPTLITGIVLLFLLMGVMIGFAGVMNKHVLFQIALPWWVRGSAIGATFLLLFTCLCYQDFSLIIQSGLMKQLGLENPLWAVLDGAIVGMIIDYLITQESGDGEDIVCCKCN